VPKRLPVIFIAIFASAWALPARAGELKLKLVLPSWAIDPPEPPRPPRARVRPKVVDAVRVGRKKRGRRARRRTTRPGPRAMDEAEATFAALKLLRVNQGAMQVCDRIASRRGEPPRRVRFLVKVNGAGAARVAIDSPVPLGPAAARCYRASAARLAYPRTGTPYTLVLSRISGRANN
jgi:hypothetical protein